jgi:hypothetical protein
VNLGKVHVEPDEAKPTFRSLFLRLLCSVLGWAVVIFFLWLGVGLFQLTLAPCRG